MYFDLYHPFPISAESSLEAGTSRKGKNKAKGKPSTAVVAVDEASSSSGKKSTSCWDGIPLSQREGFAKSTALAGHLGYNVIGCTITPLEPSPNVIKSPFISSPSPFPFLDPRKNCFGDETKNPGPNILQISRYHMRIDDMRTHCLNALNTSTLRDYDLLSVLPTCDKALQLACTDLSLPGPNQISIISLPLHEKPYHFRLNRKQIRLAQRQGVVLELLYSAGLFPPPQTPPETVRRYRQNFMSNAREVIRITGGKGVIFSSGPGGSMESLRGPMDIINLGTTLGMPANLAKDSVSLTPKMVLLRAQARKTHKAILSIPVMVPPPSFEIMEAKIPETMTGSKRDAEETPSEPESKRIKVG